eukprot:TRINITY_DN11778_c0_g1_i1.p2 TRINITY_DN11778_c0_g1~~TRINITY_DN11778_c0_g1_i1.p2  ORF type:complete len:196 (-),score=29.30 TRINITY_DN11778_c0_g1_i1:78-665(-)
MAARSPMTNVDPPRSRCGVAAARWHSPGVCVLLAALLQPVADALAVAGTRAERAPELKLLRESAAASSKQPRSPNWFEAYHREAELIAPPDYWHRWGQTPADVYLKVADEKARPSWWFPPTTEENYARPNVDNRPAFEPGPREPWPLLNRYGPNSPDVPAGVHTAPVGSVYAAGVSAPAAPATDWSRLFFGERRH